MPTRKTVSPPRVGSLQADWTHPTRIRFGVGRAAGLPDACTHLGIRRPLLVTDSGLAQGPALRRLRAANAARGIPTGLFTGATSDPGDDCIAAGVCAYRDGGHDGLIAYGGGSALDAGKGIALAAAVGPERLWDFAFRHGMPSPEIDTGRIPSIIAVPTTAGTGSEVNAAAVITDTARHVKRSLYCPGLLAGIVIADPALTCGLPPFLTAATGMDALSHSLEALCSPAFNPMLDAVALHGLGYLNDWLPAAYRRPRYLRARVYTMAASIMGAIAFEKGLGAMHAMGHAVGALLQRHHGTTVSTVIPAVLRFNRRRIEGKMARLARFLNLPQHDCREVINWILALRSALGMPGTLAELGVRRKHIPVLVDRTLADANASTNPVPLDAEGVGRLFERAIRGER